MERLYFNLLRETFLATICSMSSREGKAIMVPVLIVECSYVENKNEKTPEGLRNCAKSITDKMQGLTLTYDGVTLSDQEIHQKYRVGTFPLSVNFPPKNVFNANPPGPSTAVSDGYWVMFEPPSVGDHNIKFAGCSGNPSVVETGKFCQNVNYHLKVVGQ
jgi:hypothetical protein